MDDVDGFDILNIYNNNISTYVSALINDECKIKIIFYYSNERN